MRGALALRRVASPREFNGDETAVIAASRSLNTNPESRGPVKSVASVLLEDGSRVTLNTASTIELDLRKDQRSSTYRMSFGHCVSR
jgi:ferric-dicitrate binding protein FerR (iron transport regulator)